MLNPNLGKSCIGDAGFAAAFSRKIPPFMKKTVRVL
jgi:hypothetical protein